jgi:hypothetical protein
MTSRFELLDPANGQLPWWPYPHSANGILWRVRELLRRRTVEEVAEIAAEAEALIDIFFETERDHAIAQIEADKRHDLFEDGESGSSGIRPEAHDEYGINDRDNTTELEALDQALNNMFEPSNLEASEVHEYECLASFALMKLDDFVKRTMFKFDAMSRSFVRKSEKEASYADYNFAASHLVAAQDAVGRAELRRATERLSQKYEDKIGKLKDREKLHAEIKAEILEQERLRRQEESAARNNSRHEQNRQVKTKVLKWFKEDPAKFPSAEKAAKHFCAKLSEEGIEREQRTVADWIRGYAKQAGIKWRA